MNGTDDTAVWAGALLSALALAGLSGVVWVAIRRRKRVHDVRDVKIERPVIDHNGLALGGAAAKPLTAPAITAAFTAPAASAPLRREGSVAHAGAAVPLPRERLATPEERRALIMRMVAAQPDRANPFHGRKARLHRAKLIEQSIGRRFENGRSRIDLSQYPMNWPELAPSRPAAA